ncbi:MAG: chorismate synthase [Nitrospirae bacterium]|nr:MAG: chorismate synthase [Nitrospirota bacterium]
MHSKLRFLTSGESHGKGLTGIIEGFPAGLELSSGDISRELKRRQAGYGRGGRMKIEQDKAELISGVRWGKTMGSPLTIFIENKDSKNWQKGMSSLPEHENSIPAVTKPRPGHADLSGVMKYNQTDARNILERSSARETAMRVAVGAIAKRFLSEFEISIGSYVTSIGSADMPQNDEHADLLELFQKAEGSSVRCPDEAASLKMISVIDEAVKNGDTVGGRFVVFAIGVPVGLGSHIQWDKRLDGIIAQALMSIQAIKAVEIGAGFKMAESFGSQVLDEIFFDKDEKKFYRKTNHAGGIEGGMTNGMPITASAVMKPIPTLRKPLMSVDMASKEPFEAAYERSDACAVPAAAVVAEAMLAIIVADALLEKFGGDSLTETRRNFDSYAQQLRNF